MYRKTIKKGYPAWGYHGNLGKKFSEKSSIVGGISEKKGGKNE